MRVMLQSKRRGFALGLNEFAGYLAVGFTAWITDYIASVYALSPQPSSGCRPDTVLGPAGSIQDA